MIRILFYICLFTFAGSLFVKGIKALQTDSIRIMKEVIEQYRAPK